MTDHQNKVKEFNVKAGHEIPVEPTIPDQKKRKLDATLIFEECLELIKELGFKPMFFEKQLGIQGGHNLGNVREEISEDSIYLQEIEPGPIENVAKEMADLRVVTTGTAVHYGFDLDIVQEAVDQNNLDKFGPGHSFRDDGKLLKPKGFKKPNIKELIKPI